MANVMVDIQTELLVNRWELAKRAKTNWLTSTDLLVKAGQFVVDSIEAAVRVAQDEFGTGTGVEKKKFVLAIVGNLYDKVIYPALPILWKPASPAIKYVAVEIILSRTIDVIVEQLKRRNWEV